MEPIKTAFALVRDPEGRIALILEENEAKGLWCLPGGHIDGAETLEEGAVREAKEETGLEVAIVKKIFSQQMIGSKYLGNASENDKMIEVTIFEATPISNEIHHGFENPDARWCTKEEIEQLGFRWKFLKELLLDQ